MNFYNRHNSVSFKSHSITVTLRICAVLGAQGIRATGFKRAQGNAHCAKFESHTNRVTFETNVIRMTSSVQALCWLRKLFAASNWTLIMFLCLYIIIIKCYIVIIHKSKGQKLFDKSIIHFLFIFCNHCMAIILKKNERKMCMKIKIQFNFHFLSK